MVTAKLPWRDQLFMIVISDKSSLNVLIGVVSFMAAFGLFFGTPRRGNYDLMLGFASMNCWGVMFLLHGVLAVARSMNRCYELLNYARSFFGLWLWSYIGVSFIYMDPTPLAPFEPVLLSFALAELWVLTCSMLTFSLKKYDFKRRSTDAV